MILNCARVRPAAFAVISIAFNALRTRHYWHFFRILFSFLLLFFRVGKYTRVIYLSKNKKKKTERGIGRGSFTGVGAGNDGTEGNVSKLIRTVRFPPRSRQHTRGRINIVFARKLPEDKKKKTAYDERDFVRTGRRSNREIVEIVMTSGHDVCGTVGQSAVHTIVLKNRR